MTTKKLFSAFILCFVVFATSNAQDQNLEFLNQQLLYNLADDNFHYYEGQINLKNKDVLNGQVSVNHLKNDKQSVIYKTKDGLIYIPNNEINSVILLDNNNKDSETKFVSIKNEEKLYRELYVKDSENAIYDLLAKPFDDHIMLDVYVLENNKLTRTYNFWHSGPKADLINYFKDRDNKNYKRREFKYLDDLFAKL